MLPLKLCQDGWANSMYPVPPAYRHLIDDIVPATEKYLTMMERSLKNTPKGKSLDDPTQKTSAASETTKIAEGHTANKGRTGN